MLLWVLCDKMYRKFKILFFDKIRFQWQKKSLFSRNQVERKIITPPNWSFWVRQISFCRNNWWGLWPIIDLVEVWDSIWSQKVCLNLKPAQISNPKEPILACLYLFSDFLSVYFLNWLLQLHSLFIQICLFTKDFYKTDTDRCL